MFHLRGLCALLSVYSFSAPAIGIQVLEPGDREGFAAVYEHVRTDAVGRYTADSLTDAVLNVSSDQFMYSFAKTQRRGIEFPSAWLMTRGNFLRWTNPPERWGEDNADVELNIFVPAGYEPILDNKIPKTTDFFNFMGVHLSFWAEYAMLRGPAPEPGSARSIVKAYFEDRLSNDIARFQKQAGLLQGQNPSPLRRDTVALLPFAMSKDRHGSLIAGIMLNATFWSLRSQFDHVVLGACHQDDYEFLMLFPAWRVIKLIGEYCSQNGGMYLLSHAMKALHGSLPDSQQWEHFKYVYFTEGDVVLYLREHERILEHLKAPQRALVPHRLDTFVAVDDFPEAMRDEVSQDDLYFNGLKLFSTPVSTVDFNEVSCCLSGRMLSAYDFWWIPRARGNRSTFPLLKSAKFNSGALPITLASHGAPEVCEVAPRFSCR